MKQQIRDYVVLDRLSALGEVDPRPMFGGFGLFLEGHFFGLVQDGKLYLKVFPATVGRYEEHGMLPFSPSETTRLPSYYQVPPEILEVPAVLVSWAREALEPGNDPVR